MTIRIKDQSEFTVTKRPPAPAPMRSAKVVHLKTPKPLVLDLAELTSYAGVRILAQEIVRWTHEDRHHNTLKELAKKALLNPRTVSKIAAHETHSPRWDTCIMLYRALGFKAMRLERGE